MHLSAVGDLQNGDTDAMRLALGTAEGRHFPQSLRARTWRGGGRHQGRVCPVAQRHTRCARGVRPFGDDRRACHVHDRHQRCEEGGRAGHQQPAASLTMTALTYRCQRLNFDACYRVRLRSHLWRSQLTRDNHWRRFRTFHKVQELVGRLW